MTPIVALLLLWVAALAAVDLRQRRVPNMALLAVLIPALGALALQAQGLLGVPVSDSLLGAGLGIGLLLPGYAAGLLGAGDVKLGTTLGLLVGPVPLAAILLLAALGLGTVALWARRRGRLARMPAAPALAAGFAAVLGVAAAAT